MNTTEKIIEFFKENECLFNDCIEELDNCDGCLGDDRYYEMQTLDELYYNCELTEILRRAFYGYDADTWNTDMHGEREHGTFNPNREYFTFNGYGNLVSTNYKDYSAHLDRWAVENMSKNKQWVKSIESVEELAELFEELESVEK